MTDLVYNEMVGWYDSQEAYCTVDGCHNVAVEWKLVGMTHDNQVTIAVCIDHSHE